MAVKRSDPFGGENVGGDFGSTAESRASNAQMQETRTEQDRPDWTSGGERTNEAAEPSMGSFASTVAEGAASGAQDSDNTFVKVLSEISPHLGALMTAGGAAFGGLSAGIDYMNSQWGTFSPAQKETIVKTLEKKRKEDPTITPEEAAKIDTLIKTAKASGGYIAPQSMGQDYTAPSTAAPSMKEISADSTGAVTTFDKVSRTIDPATAGKVNFVDAASAANGIQAAMSGVQQPTTDFTPAIAEFITGQQPLQRGAAGQIGSTPQSSAFVENLTNVPGAQAGQVQTGPTTQISQELLNRIIAQAQGQGPSAAQAQLQQATDANIRAMQAAAASQRGAFNPAALRQLEQERAMAQQQAAGQSAVLAAQEQQQATQTAAGLAGSLAGTEAQTAISQAQMETQTSIQNAALSGDLAKAASELTTRVNMDNAARQTVSNQLQAQLDTQVSLENAEQENEYRKFVETGKFDASKFRADQLNKIGMQGAEFKQRTYELQLNQVAEMYRQGKLSEAQAYQLQAELDTQTAIANMDMALKAAQGDQNAQVAMNGQVNDYILKKMQLGMSYEEAKANAQNAWQQITNQAQQWQAANQLDRDKALEQARQMQVTLALKNKEINKMGKSSDSRSWFEKLLDNGGTIVKGIGAVAELFSRGGIVPGVAKVAGDSTLNDTVPAKLSPGEIVIPRTVVTQGMDGMKKFLESKLTEISGQAACGGYIGYDSVVKARKNK